MNISVPLRRAGSALAAAVLGGTMAVIGFSSPAAADDPFGELLIALDASGSMTESDGAGGTRIDTAQKAVTEVAQAMPDGAMVGLRAYGPASTGSGCQASEALVPVGPLDRDAITTEVSGLTPDGDTPIAYSLEQAMGDFTDSDVPKTILLVSDGEETCGGDPVAVAEQLTSQGVDVRIHVIGFQVDDDAREQLTEIAKAGKGAYYDAQDGPALASRLKRASTHALRPYETVGTPVEGSADGLNLPVLEPGYYVDTMPPNTETEEPSRYYAFELPADTTAHVVATVPWSTPLEVDASNNVGVVLHHQSDKRCESQSGYQHHNGGGSVTASTTATVAFDPDATAEDCGAAGTYVIEVHNNNADERHGPAPLELVLVIEPAVTTTDGLPEPYVEESSAGVEPQVGDAAVDITGSGGIGDAPLVETGKYNDILRPGEEVFYRVPVDWGQRVVYRLNLPKLDGQTDEQLGSGTWVYTDVINPVRYGVTQSESDNDGYFSGDPEGLTGSTAPVRYRNRASDDNQIAATSMSGYYYIAIRMNASVDDPYFELPITLEVDVQGDVGGDPSYDDTAGVGTPAEQLEVELASSDNSATDAPNLDAGSSATLWTGIAIGSVLAVGGGTAAWMFLRRKPTV